MSMPEFSHTTSHTPQYHFMSIDYLEAQNPHKDIVLEDGRRLEFYTNIDAASGYSETGRGYDANACLIFNRLKERGVVELPEITATSTGGQPIVDYQAVYVDARIGKGQLSVMVLSGENGGWLAKNDPRLNVRPDLQERVSAQEINELVDRGVEETGLAQQVAAMKEEDARKVEALGRLDLQAILRAARDQPK